MDFLVAPAIHNVVDKYIRQGNYGYPNKAVRDEVKQVFAEYMQRRFQWGIDTNQVILTGDLIQAMHLLIRTLTAPGDGIVVQPPIYPPFLESVQDNGRCLVLNHLIQDEERYVMDLEALEASLTPDTRLLMFCNPHNPSGRAFERDELEALAELVVRHDLLIVSDEIHADLVYEGRQHIPLATLGDEIAARTITITSATKAYNTAGLCCAVMHVGSEALLKRLEPLTLATVGPFDILGAEALMAAWRHSDDWLAAVKTQLAENRQMVTKFISKRLPDVKYIAPEATYLAWFDCSELDLPTDKTVTEYFLDNARIAFNDGKKFGPGYDRYTRLNFATSPEILEMVLERMAGTL